MNFVQQIVAEILCKALTGDSRKTGTEQATEHRNTGDKDHNDADHQHKAVSVSDELSRKEALEQEIFLPI